MILRPNFYLKSFCGISNEFLKSNNIKGLLLDIDNTLCEHDNPNPLMNVVQKLEELQNAGIKCCLVSNNQKPRVEMFGRLVQLPYIYNSKKPLSVGINKALDVIELSAKECAMVGDQLFTDIAGGNIAGLTTILVAPASTNEIKSIAFKRRIEKYFLTGFEKRGLKKQ